MFKHLVNNYEETLTDYQHDEKNDPYARAGVDTDQSQTALQGLLKWVISLHYCLLACSPATVNYF